METLKKPVVTEKMTRLAEKHQQYAFKVDKRANKIQIRTAVEAMYGVTVESVNTMRYAGNSRNRNTKGGLVRGRTDSFKKAIVTLKAGESIDYYSGL
ncbi:MAG: 50S ribosomal protein L23 [Bacteroidota bacterium]|jgi:large subunit ribosomal protein L23|nr:50S ribosomal protein L23 [Bacteroidota bacterium]MBM3913779.1 50S ribosomal protein L23 [Sphingomonadales bacterium]NBV04805.1 50S ribosomal protein L23 [Cytophagia bacterium]NBY30956.1 50S ribosomal protein L23 [Sphingobacteriia bacterium]MBM3930396.1 50S ribosomal protein L23 [Sphingomonadales bacterium]